MVAVVSGAWTPGPWALNRMDSAEEFARLKGETLQPHEGYYRTNSGAWIVTASETDEDGYQVGSPIAEVTFKGTAKRGEAYRAPDQEGQANARLIAAAPNGYAVVERLVEHLRGDFRIPDNADEGWVVDSLGHGLGGIYLDALAYLSAARGNHE